MGNVLNDYGKGLGGDLSLSELSFVSGSVSYCVIENDVGEILCLYMYHD